MVVVVPDVLSVFVHVPQLPELHVCVPEHPPVVHVCVAPVVHVVVPHEDTVFTHVPQALFEHV